MAKGEHIVLVHGLWLHGAIMRLMRGRIARYGYTVDCYSYPSVRLSLTENAQRLARHLSEMKGRPLHLVAHSMGGLVALESAALLPPGAVGRIVVVGTPYAGCFSGLRLQRLPGGRWLLGKCMGQWLSERRAEAPPQGCEVGVIAGCGGLGLGRMIAPDLPGPNDGVVCVSETNVPGMRDHIVLDVSHTAMLASQQVVEQICAFLGEGHFQRARGARLTTP